MEIMTPIAICFIPSAWIVWAFMPSAWLDKRPGLTGHLAEGMAWVGVFLAFSVAGCYSITGGQAFTHLEPTPLLGARIDALSLAMLCLVTFLGANILRFSKNYLAGDHQQGYFFKWMVFTLGAVALLVISPGLIQFFLTWVLSSLGLHKLLVYFPDRLGTLLSARKKFVVSRVGDLCLLIGFIGIYHVFGSQDFATIFAQLNCPDFHPAGENTSWMAWFIVLGAILKSAQVPFHTWLPDTMGAPTPVSALMHAGIINAGGFLVIRLSPLLVTTPSALYCLALTGMVTATFGAMVMLTQTSVKRSLAYSTIAQMGFMFLQCGLGAFHLASLHIIAHSLYKGHAFLSSGNAVDVIKQIHHKRGIPVTLPLPIFSVMLAAATFIIVGLKQAFNMPTLHEPGMLVFSIILIMAVAHLIIRLTIANRSAKGIGLALMFGAAFAGLYLLLAWGSQELLASVLPQFKSPIQTFEVILATIILTLLMAAMVMQYTSFNPLSHKLRAALYVHALNGFYLNTGANRVARAMGIPTAQRKH